jgi:hypothetical protein
MLYRSIGSRQKMIMVPQLLGTYCEGAQLVMNLLGMLLKDRNVIVTNRFWLSIFANLRHNF